MLKNPFTLWLKWLIKSRILLYKNRKKHLYLGYMANVFNSKVGKYNAFYDHVIVGNSEISDYVYVSNNTSITRAKIGKFCSIGPNVKIGLGKHPTHFISTHPAFFSTKNQNKIHFADKDYFEELGTVIIGNDVWIGANAIIMDDVEICDGAIIAAGSVVIKNVAPYEIVGGVPAKLIRKRFSDNEIDFLEKFEWWERDYKWFSENYKKFNEPKYFFNSNINNSKNI